MKIVVLAGGTSTERSVSITSGTMVCKALREKNHQAVLVDVFCGIDVKGNLEDVFAEEAYDIDKAAEYMHSFDAGLNEMIESRRRFFGPNVLELCEAADVVFLALHGANGEDGKVQATFDLLGIPYTGTGYLSSALAMDKSITKQFFRAHHVPTPNGVTLKKGQESEPLSGFGLELPVVVKPCCGGSSVGVVMANNDEEYAAALEEAYRNLLMTGKFPACVLYIDIPPNTIDVNVHPTKIEVRFSDEKLMHEAVFFAVKNSLMKNDRPNEMHLENKRNFTDRELFDIPKKDNSVQLKFAMEDNSQKPAVQKAEIPAQKPQTEKQYENSYSYQKPAPTLKTVESRSITPEEKEKLSGSDDMFLASLEQPAKRETAITELSGPEPKPHKVTVEEINKAISEIPLPEEPEEQSGEAFKFIDAQSFTKKKPVSVIVEEKEPEKPKPVVVGELFKTYVVAQVGDEMILMDKHAAHERYIFEKIKSDAEQLETQMFLEPIMVLLSYDEYDALTANLDKVSQLGFEIEPDVAPTVAVKGVPIILGDDNPADIISELAKNFIENKLNPQIELFDDLYHSIACKAAIKANDTNSGIELQALVNAVYGQENIRYCPHGRPVMITLTKRDIEKQFRRVL